MRAKRLRREYAVWGGLTHRNILPLIGLAIHEYLPSPGLVSEFKSHGNLLDFMERRKDFDRLHMVRVTILWLSSPLELLLIIPDARREALHAA